MSNIFHNLATKHTADVFSGCYLQHFENIVIQRFHNVNQYHILNVLRNYYKNDTGTS